LRVARKSAGLEEFGFNHPGIVSHAALKGGKKSNSSEKKKQQKIKI
jgi:hypothetical protein